MHPKRRSAVWAAALLACVIGAAEAQDLSRGGVAQVSYSSMEIEFHPRVAAQSWSLRVTGPAGFLLERAAEGTPPTFSVFDRAGEPLADGTYSYELRAEVRLRSSALEKSDDETADGRGYARRTHSPLPDLPAIAGTFTIAAGAIVMPQLAEPARAPHPSTLGAAAGTASPPTALPADQVIPDDLIVQSSLCVGFDCRNGESFGFDTVRLKENNTRLKFDDTSTGTFPANDWQLTANDSASGGASRFSIEDVTAARVPFTVRAGAPTNSVFVDSSGRLGLKTATPVLDIHATTGNTPALRLEQSGSGGFAPRTWDIAGNEANFFVRDATGGGRMPFRIFPGAPTNSISIASSGNVGFGTPSPATRLHLANAGEVIVRLENAGLSSWDVRNNAWGRLTITDDPTAARVPIKFGTGAFHNLLQVGINAHDQVDILGYLTVLGGITPDYVFDPGYPLESIDEHAALMWEMRHLPALPRAEVTAEGKGVIDVGARSQGLLEELEKAHIYIAELNDRVKALSEAVGAKDSALAELRRDIEAIKGRLPR
jgi:hypothetical protein